jgi:hypothetical protein
MLCIPLMILSGVNEHMLCPSLRLVLIPVSCCGYKLKTFVTTLYQALSQQNTHTHGQGERHRLCWCQRVASVRRPDNSEGACSRLHTVTVTAHACVAAEEHPGVVKRMPAIQFSSGEWVRNMASGNPLLRADTCNKRRTSSYTIWVGPVQRKRLVCKVLVVSPQVKMPSEICVSKREDNIKVNRTEVGYVWIGSIWIITGINVGLMWTWEWTTELCRMVEISRAVGQLLDPQEGLFVVMSN